MQLSALRKRVEKVNIQSYLIWKNGDIIDAFYRKKSFENHLFPIYSCSKSILSLLIGIAIDQKMIPSIKTKVHSILPEIKHFDLQIQHLLTMTSGIDWPELPKWQGKLGKILSTEKSWLTFIASRSFRFQPGEKFNYSSADSYLLGVLLSRISGMSLLTFAEKFLFSKMNIHTVLWEKNSQGFCWGGSGIRMKVTDLLKIGVLCLKKGILDNQQIVPSAWIDRSFHPYTTGLRSFGAYGLHWWSKKLNGMNVPFAAGKYGQYLYIIPSMDLVVVFRSLLKKGQRTPEILLQKYILN